MKKRYLAAALVAAGLLGTPTGASAQSVIYQYFGAPFDFLGTVSGAGDLNGDNVPDFLIGATQILGTGYVRAISGADGVVLYTLTGDAFGDLFGSASSKTPDLDGDSVEDFIVGAGATSDFAPGYARVFSGATGTALHTFVGDANGENFGTGVTGIDDVDGDAVGDLVVTAPDGPYVRVFSGADGSVIRTINGEDHSAVDDLGDVNGDNVSDFVVGGGSTYTYGPKVAGIDDVDGDLVPDVLYAAGPARVYSGADGSVIDTLGAPPDQNTVRLVSGATGSLINSFVGDLPNDSFGSGLDSAGDIDGDAVADIVAGSFTGGGEPLPPGYVKVISSATGATIFRIDGFASRDEFGANVAGIGDVNGDAVPDIAIGAAEYDPFVSENGGFVGVYSGKELPGGGCSPLRGSVKGGPALAIYGLMLAGIAAAMRRAAHRA